jgi:hypothetical protein
LGRRTSPWVAIVGSVVPKRPRAEGQQMGSNGSKYDDDDDDDDDKSPTPWVTRRDGAAWTDVREATPAPAADSEPSQPRPRWRLVGKQPGWELTFRVMAVVERAES